MGYTPTTPTLVLCQQLAAYVAANWAPTDGVSGVTWGAFARYADADNVSLPQLAGRQVVFFPTEDYEWEPENRGLDRYTHNVSCLVIERYVGSALAGRNLTVDATTDTKVTPDGCTPTSTDVGYAIRVTAGTGWTKGTYTIVAIDGGAWVLDSSPAAAGTAGGTWGRAPAAGDPTRDWWASRVDFVHEYIVRGCRFVQGGPAPFNAFLMSRGAAVQVCELSKLIGAGKLFYALVHLELLELVTP